MWNDNSATILDADVGTTTDVDETEAVIDLTDGVVRTVTIVVSDSEEANDPTAGTKFLEQIYTINLVHDTTATNSTTAGDAVRLNLQATITARPDDEITIKAPGFDIPNDLDVDDVTIQGAKPSDVSVSGTTITLVVADNDDNAANNATAIINNVAAAIRIKQAGGVKNPDLAGFYGITINDDGDGGGNDDINGINVAEVVRTVSIDPGEGASGAEVTVTGKGFSTDTARVYIDNDEALGFVESTEDNADKVLGSATISDGSFTFTTTDIKINSEINAYNLDLMHADKNATYTVTESISVSPDSLAKTDTLTITLKDWIDVGDVDKVTFTGGTAIAGFTRGGSESGDFVSYEDGENDNEFVLKVKVPADVDTGTIKVAVEVDGSVKGSANVQCGRA